MNQFDRTTTEGAARYFQAKVCAGDVEAALDCFDENAVYVPTPGTVVRGKEAIREALKVLCAMKPKLHPKRSLVFEAGDIASWVDEWELHATLPDGSPLNMVGVSSDVLKRNPKGHWVFLVDNPYGAVVLPTQS